MKNVISEIKNTISKINWEALEIYWADQYKEDYVTTLASNVINPLDFSRNFGKRKEFSYVNEDYSCI